MSRSFLRSAKTNVAFAAAVSAFATGAQAEVTLTSAGPITLDPNETLFVGDALGAQIVAYDLSAEMVDQSDFALGRAETFEGRTIIADLRGALGALMAAPAAQIAINDLAVHGDTAQIFLSGHRGLGPNATPFIARVDHGAVEILDLASLPSQAHQLEIADTEASLEFGQSAQSYAITDIDYYGGDLFVAGVSGDSFNSTLRRVPFPFRAGEAAETQIEIWHAVHAQWETRAPILAQTIAEIDGSPTLIAVYACTPLVRIPVADLRDGAKIRGEMIGELGYGNTPIDIVAFNDPMTRSENILITHTHRSANRIALPEIAAAAAMPVEVPNNFGPAGLTGFPAPANGIDHLAMIDDRWAVAVRPDPRNPDVLQLHTLLAPFFFDRADHMVEMNWPGSADPFGYRQHPALEF